MVDHGGQIIFCDVLLYIRVNNIDIKPTSILIGKSTMNLHSGRAGVVAVALLHDDNRY